MSWKRFFGSHSQILLCHGHLSHAAAERDSVVLTLVLSDPASTEGRQRHRSKRLNGNHRRRVRTIVNKKKVWEDTRNSFRTTGDNGTVGCDTKCAWVSSYLRMNWNPVTLTSTPIHAIVLEFFVIYLFIYFLVKNGRSLNIGSHLKRQPSPSSQNF